MIESQIHAVIESVTEHVFPTQPGENINPPYLIYTVTSSEPQRTLQGSGSLVKHTVQIESWAENSQDANALLNAVKPLLDGYQGGHIHRALWTGQDTTPDDSGYFHGTAVYTVWLTTANIVPTVGSNSKIVTGTDFITLTACDRVLRLDCEGVTLDGDEIGSGSGTPGPPGEDGDPGTMWTSGNYGGNEPTQLAISYPIGSYALDLDTGNVWQVWLNIHSGTGVWTQIGNLRGPSGTDGVDGEDGVDGTPGAPGSPGPNTVSGTTSTNLTGWLKGNGSTVSASSTIPVADITGTLSIAAGGTGSTSAANARSTLGLSTITRNVFVSAPTDGTLVIESKARFAFTITGLFGIKTSGGTCTLAVQINGVNVTGLSSIAVTSTAQDVTASAANAVAVGDRVTWIISASSSPANLEATIEGVR